MSGVEGKAVVVTGAASGIGAATARLFAGRGSRVVIADLQEEPGEALAAEIGKDPSEVLEALESLGTVGPAEGEGADS